LPDSSSSPRSARPGRLAHRLQRPSTTPPLSNQATSRRDASSTSTAVPRRERTAGSSLRLAVSVRRTNPASPASALSPEAASAPPLLLPISCSLHEAIGQLLCHINTRSQRSLAHLLTPRSGGRVIRLLRHIKQVAQCTHPRHLPRGFI
ncbi:hypothetical protein EJB05_09398, partial [Eragrostis curvula]